MIEPNNPILSKMLDRLFAAMLNGPSMNCRPHASRQRLDLVQIAKLKDIAPGDVLLALVGKEGSLKLSARVPVPQRRNTGDEIDRMITKGFIIGNRIFPQPLKFVAHVLTVISIGDIIGWVLCVRTLVFRL